MLIPNRFSNLKFSLLNTTSIVIDCLLQNNECKIDEIVRHLQNYSKDFERNDVLKAVTFLFALGKVDYTMSDDLVILVLSESNMDVENA